ncbi:MULTISPECIES: bifunctional 4-hydroxy-2-oxoglutarate aldolase/2-dehydro-3-deoxy-phosphogluconate aldolase [Rhizobium]|uniref:2-dehydro-3-deoxyphosphogluconate aldolase/(4S)-4-hydroxy-2-oxoglutarate aldolase n=1 Tax=Rhizobium wenxiniae TaxID=1737357 RepID=A0A7W9YC02_9HYPH|nr:bifunctional 4-hydroxy-2-oxoglutarate aldolase/2-dehydro-3-deoxy-phosphogluconate aldolase [Rhizobium wenxiniae]MBB6165826.1 2-dehydro-3-deoxyphosphogluconate aldolase/(4S)-4-hydroxy-2-oxoglutarate aldolase [Rhizobium wenxiniae]GGG19359.1 bifunctional 2-keto-4-hydroxyglutarate aldolase/2-keto-3-deoxy-6-phosphogluconate aldolase [Rhizobium wenxiniae]
MLKQEVIATIRESGIIAIARGLSPADVVPTAEALLKGGVKVFEITCNSPSVYEGIRALKSALGNDMRIGAGTVVNPVSATLALDAGADFALAPNFEPDVIAAVHERQRLMIPSVTTPTEVVKAYRLGCDLLKLFPAGSLGPGYIKDLRGPFAEAALIPVGGVGLDNLEAFARAGAFAAGVGSNLIRRDLIAAGNWQELTAEARRFVAAFAAGRTSA